MIKNWKHQQLKWNYTRSQNCLLEYLDIEVKVKNTIHNNLTVTFDEEIFYERTIFNNKTFEKIRIAMNMNVNIICYPLPFPDQIQIRILMIALEFYSFGLEYSTESNIKLNRFLLQFQVQT